MENDESIAVGDISNASLHVTLTADGISTIVALFSHMTDSQSHSILPAFYSEKSYGVILTATYQPAALVVLQFAARRSRSNINGLDYRIIIIYTTSIQDDCCLKPTLFQQQQ